MAMGDREGMTGHGHVEVRDAETGELVDRREFTNLITTAGDEYYARKAVQGIGTPNAAAPTPVTGMKLGTGTTAVSKSGAGAALVTYLAASNDLLDTTHPTVAAKGGDTGWRVQYQSFWAAGVSTDAALSEVVLVRDAATDATSTAANTVSRAVISPVINKAAGETLTVVWNHDFLGS